MASLKELLHERDRQLLAVQQAILALAKPTEVSGPLHPPPQLRPVPPRQTIGGRIRQAEAKDRREAAPLVAQRKKDYEDRIAALIRPEVEVVTDDAVHEDRPQ